MIQIKRLVAKFNIFRIKMRLLEEENKMLWHAVDIFQSVCQITAEMRQKEEQSRLKREERKPTTVIFTMKSYKERMQELATAQRIRDWGFLFTEAFKKTSSYPEQRLKKIFGVK